MKNVQELAARDAAVAAYAKRAGRTIAEIWAWKSVVPAKLDRPCDYGDACEGWHFLPKNFYDAKDVAVGFVSAEILEWQ